MFDNLREKLGSFRSDAEEAAEENVEAIEEGDLEEIDGGALEELDEANPEAEAAGPGAELDEAPREGAPGAPIAEEGSASPEPATGSGTSAAAAEAAAESDDAARVTDEPDGRAGADAESADEVGADLESADEVGADADASDDDSDGGVGFGRRAASMVRGKFVIEEEDLEGPLQELEIALLSSDVEMGVAREIVETLREDLVGETRTFTTSTGAVVEAALADAIREVISVGQFDFEARIAEADKPLTIVFTGVNGVGKTTSIAKLDRWFERRGYDTVMANGDTYRAGANEQIREHAEARGTKLISHQQGGDPAAVLYDAVEYAEANDVDVVLGDTAGRLHTDEGLMDQLEKIGRVVDPDMTLFVDEAVAGQDAVNRAREFDEAIEFDGAVLTKADADSNGGAAISIAHVTGKPILFLGVGQGYEHIERFDPDEVVERLLAAE
ncbi:signal recognition particle-docking protein FtsY [Halovivax sp.]|uniref:signal recognition particle-docking protein FtsY n=1 Tax=Halovivax sp. TaxID=1935978 RepID=UPI0025C6BBE3|nr:signal recognition particle-docking protein FtsY [Halovivax sp.]